MARLFQQAMSSGYPWQASAACRVTQQLAATGRQPFGRSGGNGDEASTTNGFFHAQPGFRRYFSPQRGDGERRIRGTMAYRLVAPNPSRIACRPCPHHRTRHTCCKRCHFSNATLSSRRNESAFCLSCKPLSVLYCGQCNLLADFFHCCRYAWCIRACPLDKSGHHSAGWIASFSTGSNISGRIVASCRRVAGNPCRFVSASRGP